MAVSYPDTYNALPNARSVFSEYINAFGGLEKDRLGAMKRLNLSEEAGAEFNYNLVSAFKGLHTQTNSLEIGEQWYSVNVSLPFPDKPQFIQFEIQYGESNNLMSANCVVYLDSDCSIINSIECRVNDQAVAAINLVENTSLAYTLQAADGFDGSADMECFVQALCANIIDMNEQAAEQAFETDPATDYEIFIPEDCKLEELAPSEALAKSLADSLIAAGYSYYKAVEILLPHTDMDAVETLGELGITLQSEWKSQMRGAFGSNLLFRGLSDFLRNSQAALASLVEKINPLWAQLLLDIEFRNDDLLYIVTLPDGDTATLSERQVIMLGKILEIQKHINPDGGKLLMPQSTPHN